MSKRRTPYAKSSRAIFIGIAALITCVLYLVLADAKPDYRKDAIALPIVVGEADEVCTAWLSEGEFLLCSFPFRIPSVDARVPPPDAQYVRVDLNGRTAEVAAAADWTAVASDLVCSADSSQVTRDLCARSGRQVPRLQELIGDRMAPQGMVFQKIAVSLGAGKLLLEERCREDSCWLYGDDAPSGSGSTASKALVVALFVPKSSDSSRGWLPLPFLTSSGAPSREPLLHQVFDLVKGRRSGPLIELPLRERVPRGASGDTYRRTVWLPGDSSIAHVGSRSIVVIGVDGGSSRSGKRR